MMKHIIIIIIIFFIIIIISISIIIIIIYRGLRTMYATVIMQLLLITLYNQSQKPIGSLERPLNHA